MPIILPTCKINYELSKSNCRCKKIENKKQKTKIKSQTRKKDKHLNTKKKLAKESIELRKKLKLKTGKLATITELIKLTVGDLRKDIQNYKKQLKNQTKTKKSKPKPIKKKNKTQKNKKQSKKPVIAENIFDLEDFVAKTRQEKIQNVTVKSKIKTKGEIQEELVTRLRSYSPAINRDITRLNITPKNLSGYSCKENEIRIDDLECLNWKDKRTEKILLDNLKSKKPVIAENILGPNQFQANCWFNVFFMIFFITDKGRKFMKNFRRSMITGNRVPRSYSAKLPQKLRYPFWLLNKFIEASLVGKGDPYLYASLMNTNDIIQQINLKLSKTKKGFYKKPGQAGNPITMFVRILEYFNEIPKNKSNFGLTPIFFNNCDYNEFERLSDKSTFTYRHIRYNKPDILIIDLSDQNNGDNEYSEKLGRIAKVSDYKKKLIYKFGDLEYKLDSAGIRDLEKEHICACLTINGEDYMFDGENATPLYKNNWKNIINKKKTFRITPDIDEQYNFRYSYQCLIYYRHK
jgi:hypothetical protein